VEVKILIKRYGGDLNTPFWDAYTIYYYSKVNFKIRCSNIKGQLTFFSDASALQIWKQTAFNHAAHKLCQLKF
jgi:hypothetical protein